MITYSKHIIGWFKQYGRKFEFRMTIIQDNDRITGKIVDFFGEANYKGIFNRNRMAFLKRYNSGRSKGLDFQYEGIYDPIKKVVKGNWIDPSNISNNGPFEISTSKVPL